MKDKQKWTESEVETLKSLYPTNTARDIMSQLPGRSYPSICNKVIELGLTKYSGWTPDKIALVKQHYSELGAYIPGLPDNSISSIRRMAMRLGLKRRAAQRWTDEQIVLLKAEYKNLPINELCQKLGGRSAASVLKKANLLGLKRK